MTIRVLHYSTHRENCGIAVYQEQYVDACADPGVEHSFFSISPNQARTHEGKRFASEIIPVLDDELRGVDILHLQHETSFYREDQLAQVVDAGHRAGARVVATVHTAPRATMGPDVRLRQFATGPRTLLRGAFKVRDHRLRRRRFYDPLRQADAVLAHNRVTADNLIELGVPRDRVHVMVHPVPEPDTTVQSTELATRLRRGPDDVLLATVGYVGRSKGTTHAVKALALLPERYKLAIVGGPHPDGSTRYVDAVTDAVLRLGLTDRVYMTGFVPDIQRLHALVRECDLCVYPYDPAYYAYVSSGALNTALANGRPVLAYPSAGFRELNDDGPVVALTATPNYYELARTIENLDLAAGAAAATRYAADHAWSKATARMATFYRELLDRPPAR